MRPWWNWQTRWIWAFLGLLDVLDKFEAVGENANE